MLNNPEQPHTSQYLFGEEDSPTLTVSTISAGPPGERIYISNIVPPVDDAGQDNLRGIATGLRVFNFLDAPSDESLPFVPTTRVETTILQAGKICANTVVFITPKTISEALGKRVLELEGHESHQPPKPMTT